MHIALNKSWRAKRNDPLAPGGYKCHCGANYKFNFGCIVEVLTPHVEGYLYMRSEVPDEHVNDCRALMHEEQYQVASPEEPCAKVPVVSPTVTEITVPVKPEEGLYKIDEDVFDQLPEGN